MSLVRTLAAALRGPGRPAGRAAPRLLVIGNCQARAAANAMRLLRPDAEVAFLSVFGLPARFRTTAELVRLLAGYDAVFAGRFAAPLRDGGTFDALKAETRLHEIPVVVFAAFHPDLVYVPDLSDPAGRRLIQSATGDYHSALVLFAYLEGLDPAAARRLFDADIYRALGYLDLWDSSAAALLEAGRLAGRDLSGDLMRWTRRGAFMHSTNHPRMFVAGDLARAALAGAGFVPLAVDLDATLPDEFIRQGTWPVYPALATHYGVTGSDVFLTQGNRRRGRSRTMPLETFIAASFAAYRGHGRSDFGCPRVAGWRADPATWASLRERAGR